MLVYFYSCVLFQSFYLLLFQWSVNDRALSGNLGEPLAVEIPGIHHTKHVACHTISIPGIQSNWAGDYYQENTQAIYWA